MVDRRWLTRAPPGCDARIVITAGRRSHGARTDDRGPWASDDGALDRLLEGGFLLLCHRRPKTTSRPQAADLLASLAANDVGVRLITGDHPITAAAIATA